MFENEKEVKKITVTYTDGSEKIIDRGVCFSVYEEGGMMKVSCAGRGSEEDCIAVLAIISQAAKECGITDDLVNKVVRAECQNENG
ncbi:MAG: hypothetical protein IJ300_12420 [Clostridia bacterium]|nr:hypothetical protein [Clostridia bacterium]MBQ8765338.1 hypothetical protein [Clostridia bacterium]